MRRLVLSYSLAIAMLTGIAAAVHANPPTGIRVRPAAVVLDSPEGSQQLLVAALGTDSRLADATRLATYAAADPLIAEVTPQGRVLPRSEGRTEVAVQYANQTVRVPVVVRGLREPRPVSFRSDVLPILSKAGCNSGGCHGKAEGQNGFKLSVFGFDAEADHDALVKEGRGRRVSLAAPMQSLLLLKATAELPHGGGQKIERDSFWHRRLARWLIEGGTLDDLASRRLETLHIEPDAVVARAGAVQQLRVTAVEADGSKRCVTAEAEYQSNAAEIANVDRDGLITAGNVPGQAAILVRYMDQVAVCRITLPQPNEAFPRPAEHNFVDRLVWDQLQQLGIPPSAAADDASFLRRVYLDTIGTLPTVDETRAFLANTDPEKRVKLVDRLLQRDEYADYWALRWSDILRVDQSIVSPQGAAAMTRWLRRQLRDNRPYDQFVRDIVTARGNALSESPAAFFVVHQDPQAAARAVSQVLLGVRIECAQCHHHPFERWSQADYYGLAGLFTGISIKNNVTGGHKVIATGGQPLKHPRSNEPVPPANLGAGPADLSSVADRREVLANWMTEPDNPFLARTIANRLWAHYFGRGLVEPIDDHRATNPATNEPLLGALADHLVELNFDLKAFTRTLLTSRVYQLQSMPTTGNALDDQNFSHAAWKPLPAEVLLDAVCQATDVPEKFNGWPEGRRAIQVWDNRMPSYFFHVFGRPQRVSVCECERGSEPSIAQALHLMNSPESVRKIRHRDGRAARLAKSALSDRQIIEQLYLATLARPPGEQEHALMRRAFQDHRRPRREAVEDILWALLNTKEFIYNH